MPRPLYWCCADALTLAVRLPHATNLPGPPELRHQVITVLDAMVGEGRAAGIPDADLAEARYALVAFVDEQVHKSNWPGRNEWMGRPLQLQEYDENTAGENFFKRMRVLLQQGRSSLALEVYYLCLVLGFRGSEDHRAIAGFRDAARQLMAHAWPASARLGPRAQPPERLPAFRTSQAPLIAVVVGSLLVALLVVVGFERLLNSNLKESLDVMSRKAVAASSDLAAGRQSVPPADATPMRAASRAREQDDTAATWASWERTPRGSYPGRDTKEQGFASWGTSRRAAYPQNVTDKPVPQIGADPSQISGKWLEQHERQRQDLNRARAKVVFLGDSITEGWRSARAYRERFRRYHPLNLGIVGDSTQHLLWRIQNGALEGTHPEVAVVLVGINNLAGKFSPQQTATGVRAVVRAVQAHLPATVVLLLAILPAGQSPKDPFREKITETNRLLADLAEPGRVSVHDLGYVLLEPDGTIAKGVMQEDTLHPTPAGYERLSEALEPLLAKLAGGAPQGR